MGETSYYESVNEVDMLISRLRYLESIECRNIMLEADRVKARHEVTIRFKKALRMKHYIYRVNKEIRAYKDIMDIDLDILYN
jgi:hypothetical protein